jgi:hypothetical protein
LPLIGIETKTIKLVYNYTNWAILPL